MATTNDTTNPRLLNASYDWTGSWRTSISLDYNDSERVAITSELKSRGYRWNAGDKCWTRDGGPSRGAEPKSSRPAFDAEIDWLFGHVPGIAVMAHRMIGPSHTIAPTHNRELHQTYGARRVQLAYTRRLATPAADGAVWEWAYLDYTITEPVDED